MCFTRFAMSTGEPVLSHSSPDVLVHQKQRLLLGRLQLGVQVADRDQPEQSALVVGYRQVTNAAVLHGAACFIDSGVRRAANDFRRHHVGDLGVGWIPAFGDDALEYVALGKNADHAIVLDHDESADLVLVHQQGRIQYRGSRTGGPNVGALSLQKLSDTGHGCPPNIVSAGRVRNARGESRLSGYDSTSAPDTTTKNGGNSVGSNARGLSAYANGLTLRYNSDMNTFSTVETAACQSLVDLAVREDLGISGDRTTMALVPADADGAAVFVARSTGVLAGLPAAALVAEVFDPNLSFHPLRSDGETVHRGDRIATIRGTMRSILMAERTMLNFLQRLSGVATNTRRYVDAVAGLPVTILDTRKTTPGWRLLEKYAVRMGGGQNHRVGLYDGILIKDNHLAVLADYSDPIGMAIRRARQAAPDLPIEIEVDSFDQFVRALACSPDIILLDNMTHDELRACVDQRRARTVPVQLEASGGVTLGTVRSIAETGVDRISVGALTHSAVALDIALDFEEDARKR